MPAMLDDPTAPIISRDMVQDQLLPEAIAPRQVMLRDRITTATLIPFSAVNQVPTSLLRYLCQQLNSEIEKGDTYPMIDPLSLETFGPYWFANFGAVMFLGEVESAEHVREMARHNCDWEKFCLGSFYVKPNYPGRSSHVCNGGFIVTPAARNRGVGRLMGEGYLEWAPKLGYTYSVFNLVYETNVASCKIWDALGFKRIGRVKGCGNLKSFPDEFVDAIIYGRDLALDEDTASEERFDKIKFYLKHGKYPNGSDRAEKSRLRSAATHYKLLPATSTEPEKLMLKGKEVISDPQKQYEIARNIHIRNHGGINKTTASIAEKFHWVRIKETVSAVIKNCGECSDATKAVTLPETTKTPARQVTHQPVTPATFAGLTQDDFRNHFSTPSTMPIMRPDPNLSAVMQFNAINSSTNPRDVPLDPRLINDLHQMQRQATGSHIAPIPVMVPQSHARQSMFPAQRMQAQSQAQAQQHHQMQPQTQHRMMPSNTPTQPQRRGKTTIRTQELRERSASPSAQLLREQEMTPTTVENPKYPPYPDEGAGAKKRGRTSAVGTEAGGNTPSSGRKKRAKR